MIVLHLHIAINRYSTVCRFTDPKYSFKKLIVAVYILRFWAVTYVLISYKPGVGGGRLYVIGQ